jgi:hypothetical protein
MQLQVFQEPCMREENSLISAQIEQMNNNGDEQTKPSNQKNRVKKLHRVNVGNMANSLMIFFKKTNSLYQKIPRS